MMNESIFESTTTADVLRVAGYVVPSDVRQKMKCPLPGHDDGTPSFRILGHGWRCFGCDRRGGIADLIIALGYASSRGEAARWIEERVTMKATMNGTVDEIVFNYVDESHAPLYDVVRKPPKTFYQRVARGDGKYEYKLNGVRRVPYRLPELLAEKARRFIFVPEGEKDVETLVERGYCATTNAQGAAWKWTPDFVEPFRGAKCVVVVPDCDKPGRAAALDRAMLLQTVVDDVRILDLAPDRDDGYDVSDWFADGHSRKDFNEIAKSTTRLPDDRRADDGADDDTDVDWGDERPWPILDRAARYGLLGEIVGAIEEETEAHPAALLFSLLVAFGNAIGLHAHAAVGDDQHPGRLFVALVGATSSGGKGTSFGAIRPLLRAADTEWLKRAHVSGFVSGEAIIAHANGKHCAAGESIEKRIFVIEPEFAALLTVNSRDGSTSSPIIRQAWDGVALQLRRSKDKVVADGAHVSILAHITPGELRAKLSSTEVAGGFANRFLFVCVKRSRKLPSGGHVSPVVIGEFGRRLREAMEFARGCGTVHRSADAEALWAEFYHAEPDRDGVLGEMTARANAQKLRLSVLYAMADCCAEIRPEHVIAAEAAWRYAVGSAEHIFGSLIGDLTQDRLLTAARDVYPNGLTRTQQRDLFNRHLSDEKLAHARAALEQRALIRVEKVASTGGRPASLVFALRCDQSDERRQKSANDLFGRLSSLSSQSRDKALEDFGRLRSLRSQSRDSGAEPANGVSVGRHPL